MSSEVDSLLEEKWREFRRLSESGAALSAIVELGEGLLLCEHDRRHTAARDRFVREIRARVDAKLLEQAAVETVLEWRRSMHILSVGTRFIWEELVPLITRRMMIALTLRVLAICELDVSAIDLEQLDGELTKVARSKENRQRFASALATIRKNWRIPIEDRWSAP